MTITRLPVPDYLRWPVNSTRLLLPTIGLKGFRGQPMLIIFAFWKWRVDYQITPSVNQKATP